MILDKLLKIGAAQAFTDADEVTASSVDLGNVTPKRRVGTGERLSVIFVVTTAGAGDSGSATDTCDFAAIESAAADLGSPAVIIQRRVPSAELVVGKVIDVPLPADKPTLRYLGGKVTLGTGDTVSADVYVIPSDQVQAFAAYAKGYAI